MAKISSVERAGVSAGTNRPPAGTIPSLMASEAGTFLKFPLVLIYIPLTASIMFKFIFVINKDNKGKKLLINRF